MINEFVGKTSLKNGLFFAGTIALTIVVVSGLYGWIYGFNYLGQSVQGAGNVLVAAFNGPSGIPPQQQYIHPGVQPQAQAPLTGQYVCPQHGAVGMPMYGQGGTPQCPVCGQVMRFVSAGNPSMVAAWNTGAGAGQWGGTNHFGGG